MDSVKQFHLQDRSVEKPVGDSSGNGVASRPQEGMDCSQSVCVCVCVCARASVHFHIPFACLLGGCVTGHMHKSKGPVKRPELNPDYSERAVE